MQKKQMEQTTLSPLNEEEQQRSVKVKRKPQSKRNQGLTKKNPQKKDLKVEGAKKLQQKRRKSPQLKPPVETKRGKKYLILSGEIHLMIVPTNVQKMGNPTEVVTLERVVDKKGRVFQNTSLKVVTHKDQYHNVEHDGVLDAPAVKLLLQMLRIIE